jgi:hypothetical protein
MKNSLFYLICIVVSYLIQTFTAISLRDYQMKDIGAQHLANAIEKSMVREIVFQTKSYANS